MKRIILTTVCPFKKKCHSDGNLIRIKRFFQSRILLRYFATPTSTVVNLKNITEKLPFDFVKVHQPTCTCDCGIMKINV